MCDKNIIIRADYYPNGEIIPLCVTFSNGDSFFLNRITKIENDFHERRIIYHCSIKDKKICLIYQKNVWIVEYCTGKT